MFSILGVCMAKVIATYVGSWFFLVPVSEAQVPKKEKDYITCYVLGT